MSKLKEIRRRRKRDEGEQPQYDETGNSNEELLQHEMNNQYDSSTDDDDYQCEEEVEVDETSCDEQLVDEDNDFQGEDVELEINMPFPLTRLDICAKRQGMSCVTNEQEAMGYSFDVDTDYENSDEFESLDDESDEEKDRFPKFNVKTDMINPTFKVGMVFSSFQVLKEAVQMYSVTNRYILKFKKNDLRRLRVVCKDRCPWVLYATPIQDGHKIQIKTYIDQHTCCKGFENKYITYIRIAHKYLENIRADPEIKLATLKKLAKDDFGIIDVPDNKLWRAKRHALKLLRGDEKQQFSKLADYGGELRSTNPESALILSLDNLVFKRAYVCLSGCKNGFNAGCRPIISIDGCFLKGRYGGQLLAAVGVDPNDCIWPIAYAIVDVESRETWTWFLQLLGEELGIQNSHKWTFMSDRQKGLIQAVETLFPNAEHRFCVRHLISNFRKNHHGETLKNAVWGAATSSYKGDYNKKMEYLKSLSADAWTWMHEIPSEYWSRSHFRVDSKCDILLNNMSECFNKFILSARDKPILTMLEIIRCKIMVRIAKKKERMSKWSGLLCPKIQKKLEKIKEESKSCWISPSGGAQFQVSCPAGQFVVDLATRTCSCRKWQLTGIPCTHACATLAYNGNAIEDFVDQCYTISVCNVVYDNIINPIRSMDQWEDVKHTSIQPPRSIPPKRGRPKKKRRKEQGERERSGKMKRSGMVMHCTRCGGAGHNKRGCKSPTEVLQTEVTKSISRRRRGSTHRSHVVHLVEEHPSESSRQSLHISKEMTALGNSQPSRQSASLETTVNWMPDGTS